MPILDLYPSQGCYAPGETITLIVEIAAKDPEPARLRVEIGHLAEPPETFDVSLDLIAGDQSVSITWAPPAKSAGYSANAELYSSNGDFDSRAATAFDVLPSWVAFPRYGFLSDFNIARPDPETTLKELTRFHINGLQFYDWQYRHDQLLAPVDDYIDPLGRPLSLPTVRNLVDAAHRHGIATLPYLAVYAASAGFWRNHPDWALFDQTGKPIPFGEDFLGLMNPSAGSPWSEHLLAEAARALREIPFDGIHIDQYGEPKLVWDSRHELVDLPRAFVEFIRLARIQHPDWIILFNAVGNWPIEALSVAPLDFLYIEVWPPMVEYHDLARIVLNAVQLSHGKQVVIALYLPADRPANILLADAIILACGGTRIELGEQARLLADPYFPKHQLIPDKLSIDLRQFYDFIIRSGEWVGAYNLLAAERERWAAGELNPGSVKVTGSIWSVARCHPTGLTLSLVNFTGLETLRWDAAHPAPLPCYDFTVRLEYPQRPERVIWSCPEQTGAPQPLDFEYARGELSFKVPHIQYMGLIFIHD